MFEQEIRFSIPEGSDIALERALCAVAGPCDVVELRARYFDTAQRALARSRASLRLRREGGEWIQTFKAATTDGVSRLEHNLPRVDDTLDLHALMQLPGTFALDGIDASDLSVCFETRVERTRAVLGMAFDQELMERLSASVEVALDRGEVSSGVAGAHIREIEFELLEGELTAMLHGARRWQSDFGLVLAPMSKAERGDRLARGESLVSATSAAPIRLERDVSLANAFGCVFDNCFDQLARNLASLADGGGPDCVHQARVGIRRLRTALKFFDGWIDAAPAHAEDELKTLFRGLGARRDLDVVRESILPLVMAANGEPVDLTSLAGQPSEQADRLARGVGIQAALLDLLAWRYRVCAGALARETPLLPLARERLRRWLARSRRDAGRFARIDDAARHDLRKRLKRLRYGLEFCAGFYDPKRRRSLLKPLQRLQELLGDWADLTVARDVFERLAPEQPAARDAVEWSKAALEGAQARMMPELLDFADKSRASR